MSKTIAILISRQALRPTAQTHWVQRTIEAVRWAKVNGYALCGSVGLQTWELVTALGSMERLPQRVFLPTSTHEQFECHRLSTQEQFDLLPSLTEFVAVCGRNVHSSKDDLCRRRDEAVLREADLLVPVSIRSGGRMHSLAQSSRKNVCNDFQTKYSPTGRRLAYSVDSDDLNPEIASIDRQFLVHWTRGVSTAWTEERKIDYYRDIIGSEHWPRDGLATLRRIMRMKRIIASSLHMPGRAKTVSFSSLSPVEAVPLMRWRSRYREMSFEPYGVGIEADLALERGLRSVIYHQHGARTGTSEIPRWRQQSSGREADWRREREFRSNGDFLFDNIPADRLILFCRYQKEATLLESEFGIRTVSFLRKGSDDQTGAI